MSTYCTSADIEAVFGTENVALWSKLADDDDAATIAARKVTAIAIASDEMDEVLRTITGQEDKLEISTVPDSVTDKVAIRAGLWLYSPRRTDDASNQGGQVEVLEKQYLRWLAELRKGYRKLKLG